MIEIVLSVVLAELSYRFIETPIRHGIIGEYLNILRSRPKSRQEKKRQIQVARRSLKVMAGTFVLTVSLILCMIFVPKKNALDTLQKREAKAKETGKMTEEQLAKQKANGSESEDTICTADLTDDEIMEGLNLLLIGDSIAVDVTDDFYKNIFQTVSVILKSDGSHHLVNKFLIPTLTKRNGREKASYLHHFRTVRSMVNLKIFGRR